MALDFAIPTGGIGFHFMALQPENAMGGGGQPSCA